MNTGTVLRHRVPDDEIEACETSAFQVLTFAIGLPDSIAQGFNEPALKHAAIPEKGIVGTITKFDKSIMVHLGWGNLSQSGGTNDTDRDRVGKGTSRSSTGLSSGSSLTLSATSCSMGPLYMAMPRTRYQGAFQSGEEAPTSKLIGSASEEEETIARQMCSRLSHKLGRSVSVSCDLANAPSSASGGVDSSMIMTRAAALAEREIYRILSNEK